MQANFLDKSEISRYYGKKGGVDMTVFLLMVFCVAFVFLLVKSVVLARADHKEGFVMRWNTFVYLLLASACLCGMMLCMLNLQ